MTRVNDMETFKDAVNEMMAYRNRRTRRSEKKIKITSVETDEEIIVENLAGRFRVGFGAKRGGRFEEEVWSNKISYNKATNTLTFEDAIVGDDDAGTVCYDLEKYGKMRFVNY